MSASSEMYRNHVGMKLMEDISPSKQQHNKAYMAWLEAQCQLYGHGIEPNKENAITWFERSAKEGEPKSIYALGCIYEEGIGVRIDKAKAL